MDGERTGPRGLDEAGARVEGCRIDGAEINRSSRIRILTHDRRRQRKTVERVQAADELAELGLVRLSARGLLRVAALQEQDGNVADALAAYRQAAAVAGLAASDRT